VIELFTGENAAALVTLTLLEIVLGIDNIVVLAIVTGKLPPEKQGFARNLGLALAMIMRILLLLSLNWMMSVTEPLFHLSLTGWEHGVSLRDLILIVGGLFLLLKATYEIHDKMEGAGDHGARNRRTASFGAAIVQIVAMDIIFSLDSVITAVGMAQHIPVMVAAIVVAVGVMFVFAGAISRFVEKHPTIKMLALAFLILIGVVLIADGLGNHVPKGYIYTAMAFSLGVEMINVRLVARMRHRDELRIRQEYEGGESAGRGGKRDEADSNRS
jgi:predicted tellurium resistance membrane protein TerC